MDWDKFRQALGAARLPSGYRFDVLRRADVPELVDGLKRWYPDISVGSASTLMRPAFYARSVRFEGRDGGDTLVVTISRASRIVGVVVSEVEPDGLALYGKLIAISPEHRGARLGHHSLALIESIGRELGMGLVHGMATLKAPQIQQCFERLGWQLVGIVPGLDRELDPRGQVRRMYEAIYVKVLASRSDVHLPCVDNMTANVRALFLQLFGQRRNAS